jgi:hypothetical protein
VPVREAVAREYVDAQELGLLDSSIDWLVNGSGIGELALGSDFDGVLPWGHIDNRPYLRCFHGVGLCQWRLGDLVKAAETFTRMLWLNPSDNQGARFNLADVQAGRTWEECQERDA